MGYPIPKLVYSGTTFQPTLPPVNKPGPHDGTSDLLKGQRADSITLSGQVQRVWWRTDRFIELQMESVPQSDLPAWNDFFEYAIPGGDFDYFPDAAVETSRLCILSDTDWTPAKLAYLYAKFKCEFQIIG